MHLLPKPSSALIPHQLRPQDAEGRKLTAAQPVPGIILVNGIFCFSANEWQIPACQWGNANAPQYAWGSYWYDADALLTGVWRDQHSDGLYAAWKAMKDGGAPSVTIVSHSEGGDVTANAFARHPDLQAEWISLAAAQVQDCNANGINSVLKSGQCNRVILGVSANDGVLGSWLQWFTPFFWGKTLGLNGPTNPLFAPWWTAWGFSPSYIPHPGQIIVGVADSYSHQAWVDGPNVEMLKVVANMPPMLQQVLAAISGVSA